MYTARVHFFTNLDLFCIDNASVIYRKIRYMRTVLSSIPGLTADYPVRFPGLTSVTSKSTPGSTVNYTTNTSSKILSKTLSQVFTPYYLGSVCGL